MNVKGIRNIIILEVREIDEQVEQNQYRLINQGRSTQGKQLKESLCA